MERQAVMADEPKQQSQAPSGAPRREGPGGHGGGHGPGGGHGGPRREGGPRGPGGPRGRPPGERQNFPQKKSCKFCVGGTEEGRGGEEGRFRWAADYLKKKKKNSVREEGRIRKTDRHIKKKTSTFNVVAEAQRRQ